MAASAPRPTGTDDRHLWGREVKQGVGKEGGHRHVKTGQTNLQSSAAAEQNTEEQEGTQPKDGVTDLSCRKAGSHRAERAANRPEV
jgi:hypothetical protein